LTQNGDEPFFVHASFIRPHPPRRNPVGYHDCYDAEQIGPFVGCASPEEEAAVHPFGQMVMSVPQVMAPHDERDRRQVRATYYGAQREVDDGLGQLFAFLEQSGLAASTLIIVTSDHGDMAGDHWLLEKLGYWDESYHVPLIVVDPRRGADSGRGSVVEAFTESVDVLPTICEFIGADVPLQADGWSLSPFISGQGTPEHWRDTAHFEWNFSDPADQMVESFLNVPMSHCSLAVARSASHKYVQFATSSDLFAPLLFDLREDPQQIRNLCGEPDGGWENTAWQCAQELLQWHMRTAERTLSGDFLSKEAGLVSSRDTWR
jgi:arylsulfatase A-like enzyme